MSGKQIIWENDGMMIDSVIVSANDDESGFAVIKYLIEMFTNKPLAQKVFECYNNDDKRGIVVEMTTASKHTT